MMVRQANRVAAMEAPEKDDLIRFTKADFLDTNDGSEQD
jgi:hypothetical protein